MTVEITAKYAGHLECEANHGPSGDRMTTDAPTDNGGRGAHFSPTDLVGTALGTCALTVMGIVAKREGLDLTGATARVVKEMVAAPARRIGSLTTTITFPRGLSLTDIQKRKLEAAAAACPVRQSLHPDTNLETIFIYP